MADFTKDRFSSKSQTWETPWYLFNPIQERFHLERDLAASEENKKLPVYWSEQDNCLLQTWSGRNWLNPPFKNMQAFIKKAYEERKRAFTVLLIPARTNTVWWHRYCMQGEILFLQGRPKFKDCKHGLPTPLALVIFGGDPARQGTMGSFVVPQAKNRPG